MKRILMMATFLVGLFLAFVACGGTEKLTCDDVEERCIENCRVRGSVPAKAHCSRMADYPRFPCTCVPGIPETPAPIETQPWDQW